MKTITTNTDVYEFRELPPEAQKRAIGDVRNNEYYLDYPWHEFTIEEFVNDRTNEGWDLTTDKVHYSGFWSQGDGASFDATLKIYNYLNFHNLTEKYPLITKMTSNETLVWGKTHTNSYSTHYSHERTRYFELDHECEDTLVSDGGLNESDLPAFRDEVIALEKEIEDDRLDLSQKLYRTLEKEYDYLMSDDSITDHIISNDSEFTLDGKQY
jgi:hypothetical protein